MTDISIPAICRCLDAEWRFTLQVAVVCWNCGQTFFVSPPNAGKTVFCTRKDCRRAYNRRQYRRRNGERG